MRTTIIAILFLLLLPILATAQKRSYRFNRNGISREVLENYLVRWAMGRRNE